jgi:tRNA wybutosine-synthesizing protein 2
LKFKDFLAENLQDAPRSLLPSRARIIDKVALIRIPEELEKWVGDIGRLTLQYYPRVRAVYRWIGVEGVERRPVVQHITGEHVRIVEHKEHGWKLRLDIERLMLCLGNSYERLRLASMISCDEVIIDMFAGVGQFTIPMAVIGMPRKIYAIEINPEAYNYLRNNVMLNNVQEIVEPILGDCKKIVGGQIREIADRIVMGYFGGTLEAIPQALRGLKPSGGVIHFHELVRRGSELEFIKVVCDKIQELGYEPNIRNWRIVKSYSKTKNHVVIDIYSRLKL